MPWDPLTAEQREIRELVRSLARERIAPRAAEIDETHEFPWDVVELYREHGLFGLFFGEEWGGTGTGALLPLVVIEEVSKVCATSGLILAVQSLGSLGLELGGSPEQQQRFLPLLASGEWLAAYALTEAGSGPTRRRCGRRPGSTATPMCWTARSGSSRTRQSRTCTPCSRRPIRRRVTPGSRPSCWRPEPPGSRWRAWSQAGIAGSLQES